MPELDGEQHRAPNAARAPHHFPLECCGKQQSASSKQAEATGNKKQNKNKNLGARSSCMQAVGSAFPVECPNTLPQIRNEPTKQLPFCCINICTNCCRQRRCRSCRAAAAAAGAAASAAAAAPAHRKPLNYKRDLGCMSGHWALKLPALSSRLKPWRPKTSRWSATV